MNILAFDSTARILTVGITNDGRTSRRWDAPADRARGNTLDGLIERALAEASLARGAIDGIALVTGPGSLTALRIGWSTASGWALSMGIPVTGWTTADIQRRGVQSRKPTPLEKVYCLVHHRSEEYYVYDLSDGRENWPPAVTTRSELNNHVESESLIIGPGLLHDYHDWRRNLPDGVRIADESDAIVGGDQLAVWGYEDLGKGRVLDLAESPLDYGLPPAFRKSR